jgi:hypothetical protein
MLNEGNQIHNFISSSGSGTVINYGSDFLTSSRYGSVSGSTSQKVTVPTVPVPQRCPLPVIPCSGVGSMVVTTSMIFSRPRMNLSMRL